jgi:hypothetical protein
VSEVAVYEESAASDGGRDLPVLTDMPDAQGPTSTALLDTKLAQWLKEGKGEVSKIIDPQTGEPRVVSGMFVKTHNNSFDELPPSAKEAYEIGARIGKQYDYDEGKFLYALRSGDLDLPDYLFFNGIEGYFFDAGRAGKAMPSEFVFAERIGDIPQAGVSYNFRDQHPESGVSVLGLLDPEKGLVRQNDGMFEIFNDGVHHYVSGWLINETGSDGEPLLLGAKRFKEKIQIKSATGNSGNFGSDKDEILDDSHQTEEETMETMTLDDAGAPINALARLKLVGEMARLTSSPPFRGGGCQGRIQRKARRVHPGVFAILDVSIHARNRATTAFGRAYASPKRDYPPEGGGFQPEFVFDEGSQREERPPVHHERNAQGTVWGIVVPGAGGRPRFFLLYVARIGFNQYRVRL